jgi:hypothetical protein
MAKGQASRFVPNGLSQTPAQRASQTSCAPSRKGNVCIGRDRMHAPWYIVSTDHERRTQPSCISRILKLTPFYASVAHLPRHPRQLDRVIER